MKESKRFAASKLLNRLVAIVLCLCSVFSLLPVTNLSTEALDEADIYITCEGVRIEELDITQSDRVPVKAEIVGFSTDRFQWQILADPIEEQWVDIYDMKEAETEISYALITSILDESESAYIRCTALTEDVRICSNPICVTVLDSAEPNVTGGLRAPMLSAAKAPGDPGDDSAEFDYITINYLSAEAPYHRVFTPYTAKIAHDAYYSQIVPSPTQIGYAPFYSGVVGEANPENATLAAQSLNVEHVAEAGNIVYNVYYKAIDVPYSVRYFFQNINDDGYTVNDAISFRGMAKTGTIVQDNELNQPAYDFFGVDEDEDFGFSSLYHYPESVAADGSTVFECYFDRNYYLLKFDLDGGYGVEPVYARFGTSFSVTPPTKAGFVFKGWDMIDVYTYDVYINVDGVEMKVGTKELNSEEYMDKGSPSTFMGTYTVGSVVYPDAVFRFVNASGDGTPDKPDDRSHTPLVFNGSIEASAVNYKAIWETQMTNVTVVYWRENADDTNFSYWGSYSTSAMSNSLLDGETYKNNLSSAGITSETQYFTYLYADKDVRVMGDGSTVVNVYYSRNHYTIFFDGVSTRCELDEHTHLTDECYHYLCTAHAHSASCYGCGLEEIPHTDLCCGLANHTHGAECYVNCEIPEHAHDESCNARNCLHVHNADCCSLEVHDHSSGCVYTKCGLDEHTHAVTCYPNVGANPAVANGDNYSNGRPTTDLQNGQVYVRSRWIIVTIYYRSIYYNGTWYVYNGSEGNGTYYLEMNCGKVEHAHSSECCSKPTHDHTSGCNSVNCAHECTFENGCITIACGKIEHTHSEACHFRCGKVEHTHNDSCCDVPEHIHERACYTLTGTYGNNNRTITLGTATTPSFTQPTTVTINGVTLWYDNQASTNSRYLYLKIGDQYYRLNQNGNGITYGNRNNINNLALNRNCAYSTEHKHGDGNCHYACVGYEHEHTDSCFGCGKPEHAHGDGNCVYTNCTDPTHHVHTDECLSCGFDSEHVHDETCNKVLDCRIPEHTHTTNCTTARTGNYHYGFTAKYGQNIVDLWPIWTDYTADDNDLFNAYSTNKFISYSFEGSSSAYATRRQTMTPDMCDTTDGIRVATATFNGSANQRQANYYFESFDQSGPATATHVLRNGVYYDLDEREYTQSYYTTNTSLGAKTITGMQTGEAVNSGTTTSLYYRRNKYQLDFKNYDNQTIPGMTYSLMYQQALNGDTSVNTALHSIPPYPSSLEPNAYEFAGWYTTEGRYAGTEYTEDLTMDAGPMTLFAKWVPVKHTVRFFETYDLMVQYEQSVAAGTPDESLVYVKPSMPSVPYKVDVDHGLMVGSLPNPDKHVAVNPNGSTFEYDFGGWFVVENEQKKAFTPLDMAITKDTNVYADWGTHTAQPYAVYYVLNEYETDPTWLNLLGTPTADQKWKDTSVTIGGQTRKYVCLEEKETYRWFREVADWTRGYAYQGTTRTFAAKAGETYHQLYTDVDCDFNSGYYPTPASHSITMVYEENSLVPVNNVFAFRYVHVDKVNYTVRYLDAVNPDPAHPLHEEKMVYTQNAVVSERFLPITDYVPDAFYKQCILAVVEDPEHEGVYVSSPENIITFYYSKNETSTRYTVHFLLQKADSTPLQPSDFTVTFNTDEHSEFYGTYSFSSKFEESGSRIDGISDKDTAIKINPIHFAGFNLIENRTQYSNGMNAAQSVPYLNEGYTITPVLEGTDLFIFYERQSYPYKIYYLKYGTPVSVSDLATYTTRDEPNGVLADTAGLSDELTALYGTNYSADAIDIDGYVCVSSQAIEKAITPIASNNYIIFFYMPEQYTIQYEVVGGVGGELSRTLETGTKDAMQGSLATAKPGYTFVGWFVDEACTIPAGYDPIANPAGKGTLYSDETMTAEASGEEGLFVMPYIPRLIPNGQAGSDESIFYAKFSPLSGELTINRTNSANEGHGDQIFIYEVRNKTTNETIYVSVTGNGSVTIKDIPLGNYTVTQLNDWSYRFSDAAKDITVSHPTGDSVTFNGSASNDKWLNGNGDVAVNKKG